MGEDGLGPEPEGDPAFEPVEAELGPAVGELAVERAGSIQDGQGVLRLAEVVQVPGEVVLGAEEEPGFPGRVDEGERLADVGEAPLGVDVADGVAHLEEDAALQVGIAKALVDLHGFRERGFGDLDLAQVVHERGFEADEVGLLGGISSALLEEAPRFVESPARASEVGGQPFGVAQVCPSGGQKVGGELLSDLHGTELLGDLDGEVDDIGCLRGLGAQVAPAPRPASRRRSSNAPTKPGQARR